MLQKINKQLGRPLVVVDDAPRVAGNAPRAEVLDDGLDVLVVDVAVHLGAAHRLCVMTQ